MWCLSTSIDKYNYEEQVENVKTLLRLIPLLIRIVGGYLYDNHKWTSSFPYVATER